MPRKKIYKDPPNVVTRFRAGRIAQEDDKFGGFSQIFHRSLIASTPVQRDPKGKFVSKSFPNIEQPAFSMDRAPNMATTFDEQDS